MGFGLVLVIEILFPVESEARGYSEDVREQELNLAYCGRSTIKDSTSNKMLTSHGK
jgi:hypothetical protein